MGDEQMRKARAATELARHTHGAVPKGLASDALALAASGIAQAEATLAVAEAIIEAAKTLENAPRGASEHPSLAPFRQYVAAEHVSHGLFAASACGLCKPVLDLIDQLS